MWLTITVVTFIIGVSLGLHVGLYLSHFKKILETLRDREPEPISKVITPKPAGYADVNNMTSGIITPKPPAVIRMEEEQRLRDMQ